MTIQLKAAITGLAMISLAGSAWADAGHTDRPNDHLTQMQQHIQGQGMMGMMGEGMLAMPQMDPARGRRVFAEKGCVVCHSVNGVGGEDAPALDASTMTPMMNPFEFAAKMWDGAEAMVFLQRDELGEPIQLTGQDLADIIAFAHSHAEQAKFTEGDIPESIRELIEHGHEEGEEGEGHMR